MARGGARVKSGPPKDQDALRNNKPHRAAGGDVPSGWTALPVGGRATPTPEWPLSLHTAREREVWEQEWRRPQAWMWERHRQERQVAMYVRRSVEAEEPGASAALNNLVIRMADSLGITEAGLRYNQWIIVASGQSLQQTGTEPTVTEKPSPTTTAPARPGRKTTKGTARERFEVVNGGKSTSR